MIYLFICGVNKIFIEIKLPTMVKAAVDAPRRFSQHDAVKPLKAIAAMSLNRVIGAGPKIPWHLPEDFKWFKQMTSGHIIVMGRKTFEAIGKALPNRTTIVLSRSTAELPGIRVISDLGQLEAVIGGVNDREVFICGGAQVYEQMLPFCSDLYLTLVKRNVQGDILFPAFENQFELVREVLDREEFKILHYRNNSPEEPGGINNPRISL